MSLQVTPYALTPILYQEGIAGNLVLTSIFLAAGFGAICAVPLAVKYSHKYHKLDYGSFFCCLVIGGGIGATVGGYAATAIALRILNLNK